MAYPTLTPSSTISVSKLPITGNVDNVNATDNPLPYGVYITNARSGSALTGFKQGAADQVTYPKFSFQYAGRVGDAVSTESGLGGATPIYSASFDTVSKVQDYDLQSIIKTTSTTDADSPFYQKLGTSGNNRITVRKVYYKTPNAMWRFYGYYGGLNTVGNLSYYGQYSDDSTFELIPTWQNKAQAMAFEDAIYTRASHFSYEIKDNNLRLFPSPVSVSPKKMWVEFSVRTDPWEEEAGKEDGATGVNNMNTLPFENIPYDKINSIGKQWIRRFALAVSKEMLGLIRSKFTTIPIPNENVTLNGPSLVSEAKEQQNLLREELKTVLDELTYEKLAEKDGNVTDSTQKVLMNIPPSVFVG